jgi:hypothetical protein
VTGGILALVMGTVAGRQGSRQEGVCSMESQRSFEQMTDAEIRSAVGMTTEADGPSLDAAAQARVFANELIRSRGRFTHHRALYAAFINADKLAMIENLDEIGDGRAIPAKLVFLDEAPGPEVTADPLLRVWTERALLEALTEERAIQDYFAALLDELAPRLTG